MNGLEYFFSGLAMSETGPQQMLGGADVIRVREQSPTGCATVQVHLLFNRHAEVLDDMKPIRDFASPVGHLDGRPVRSDHNDPG